MAVLIVRSERKTSLWTSNLSKRARIPRAPLTFEFQNHRYCSAALGVFLAIHAKSRNPSPIFTSAIMYTEADTGFSGGGGGGLSRAQSRVWIFHTWTFCCGTYGVCGQNPGGQSASGQNASQNCKGSQNKWYNTTYTPALSSSIHHVTQVWVFFQNPRIFSTRI